LAKKTTTKKKGSSASGEDAPTFEQSLEGLEAIVHSLEDGQLGLDDSLTQYEQGVRHLKHCYRLLDQAERRIELLTSVDESGQATTELFDETPDSLEAKAESRVRTRSRKPKKDSNSLSFGTEDDVDGSPGLF